jgi:hypothetical protein
VRRALPQQTLHCHLSSTMYIKSAYVDLMLPSAAVCRGGHGDCHFRATDYLVPVSGRLRHGD